MPMITPICGSKASAIRLAPSRTAPRRAAPAPGSCCQAPKLPGARTVTRRYVPGAAVDERLADINAQTGAVHVLHTGRQNSVIAISDAAGNPVARRGYGTCGGSADTPDDLGICYYRARWYAPQLGSFLQTDP